MADGMPDIDGVSTRPSSSISTLAWESLRRENVYHTMNRLSFLLTAENESDKHCSLCKDEFHLLKWKVSLFYL